MPINGPHSALNHNYLVTIRLDYLVHAAIYVPWIILVWLSTGKTIRTSPARMAGWVILSLLFAAAMEGVQYFIPYRAYNINDLLSNLIGVVLGFAAVAAAERVGSRQ